MDKLFHFDSPQEVYKADACVISCFDARFERAVRKFLGRRRIETYDNIRIPGSAKALAAPESDADRDFVLRMIRTSIRLHQPSRMVLIGHNDCGAYPDEPPAAVVKDLRYAAEVLHKNGIDLPVDCYFSDFDGIYSIAQAVGQASWPV